jgi:hypothetical protein
MIMPWLIGQAFVQVGPGAMVMIVLASIILNIFALVSFTRVSVKTGISRV